MESTFIHYENFVLLFLLVFYLKYCVVQYNPIFKRNIT